MQDNLPISQEHNLLVLQDQHQYEIAKLNIEKTCEDNAMWAQHWFKMRLMAYIFSGFTLILLLIFCAIAMYFNKDAIALEILKSALFTSAGLGVGYAYGLKKGRQNPQQ